LFIDAPSDAEEARLDDDFYEAGRKVNRRRDSILKPAVSMAAAVSRAGWQPPPPSGLSHRGGFKGDGMANCRQPWEQQRLRE
jgi:hypothetical protein